MRPQRNQGSLKTTTYSDLDTDLGTDLGTDFEYIHIRKNSTLI